MPAPYKFLFLFSMSAAALAFEIILTRSVFIAFEMSFAPIVLSFAIFGFSLGSFFCYKVPRPFAKWPYVTAVSFLAMALFYGLCFYVLSNVDKNSGDTGTFLLLTLATLFFVPLGAYVTALFINQPKKSRKIYAIDLLAAGFGVLLALGLLHFTGRKVTLFAIYMILSLSALGAILFCQRRMFLFLCLTAVSLLFIRSSLHDRIPCWVDQSWGEPKYTVTNAFSQVDVYSLKPSDLFRTGGVALSKKEWNSIEKSYVAKLDCRGRTMAMVKKSEDAYAPLRRELQSAPFEMRQVDSVVLLGSGLGLGVDRAKAYAVNEIHAIEINPTLTRFELSLLSPKPNYLDKGVRLSLGENRRVLMSDSKKYDLVFMSYNKNYGRLGVTPSALIENGQLTLEALELYWSKLNEKGMIFIVDERRYLRGLSANFSALIQSKKLQASQHLFIIRGRGKVTGLGISKSPITEQEIKRWEQSVARNGFQLQRGLDGLKTNQHTLLLTVTDDHPIVRRLTAITQVINPPVKNQDRQGTYRSFLYVLIGFAAFSLLLMATPILQSRGQALVMNHSLYYFLIGAVFMAIQTAFIKSLSFYLSYPIYAIALSVLLMLWSSSLGSALLKLANSLHTILALAVVILLYFLGVNSNDYLHATYGESLSFRLAVAFAVVSFVSVNLGWMFPRRTAAIEDEKKFLGLFIAINGSGAVFGGVFASVLFELYGISSIYLGCSALLSVALLLDLIYSNHRKIAEI